MNTAVIAILVSIAGIVITLVFSALSLSQHNRRENEDEGKDKGSMMSDIGYIKAGVDDLKRDTKDNSKRINILIERISRNEESTKQAHKRIDEVNKKIKEQ